MMQKEIRLLKHAIKKGEEDPFLYTNEEMHKLKKKLRTIREWKRSAIIAQKGGFGYDV
ncbi:hypothetical protein SSSM5_054 [Synechococcus phage S-SSM5]|uniref:Uncharacterized protein n=1 Tax=Synechococcus phage S-SSM5 TaxID=445685 RepID=E3SK94_9CAUD|nr:hypothetical protein SSSM5_054 [Synechococcus phage S-SSM5]ADO98016.1 hypothetical protein SSSM5_054 [Synechococcus phage S-SSM5]